MQSPVYVSDIIGIDFSPKELDKIESEAESVADSEESTDPDTVDTEDLEGAAEPGDDEESGKDSQEKPKYFYYVSKDTLVKVNKDDPSDTEETRKAGSTNLFIDEENQVVYYVYLNRFIIRSPLNGGQIEYVVRTANKITSMVYDPPSGKLYFTDSSGTIESYDTKTKARNVLYRGRDNPQCLSLSPPNKRDPGMPRKLIWKEGSTPGDTKIISAPSANPNDSDIVIVGQSPELVGTEQSISQTPKGDVYYFVRDNRVYKFTPQTKKVDKVSDTPASSVIALPEGALFTTDDNKVCFGAVSSIRYHCNFNVMPFDHQ